MKDSIPVSHKFQILWFHKVWLRELARGIQMTGDAL